MLDCIEFNQNMNWKLLSTQYILLWFILDFLIIIIKLTTMNFQVSRAGDGNLVLISYTARIRSTISFLDSRHFKGENIFFGCNFGFVGHCAPQWLVVLQPWSGASLCWYINCTAKKSLFPSYEYNRIYILWTPLFISVKG